MGDYFLKCLQNWGSRWRRLNRSKKKNLILALSVLILGIGIFFFVFPGQDAFAKKNVENQEKIIGDVDPLNKIGKGMEIKECQNENKTCKDEKKREKISFLGGKISELVSGHPLEEMALQISQKNENVASFMVAIAKKESDWGLYSPKKNGRDCFNYWGYKGGQNPTEGGYSCFDSPEQAVDVVGERIEDLLNKGIDTPEKMLVWKCGSSCAGHDPQGVRKWVADVSLYKNKLN